MTSAILDAGFITTHLTLLAVGIVLAGRLDEARTHRHGRAHPAAITAAATLVYIGSCISGDRWPVSVVPSLAGAQPITTKEQAATATNRESKHRRITSSPTGYKFRAVLRIGRTPFSLSKAGVKALRLKV